MISKNYEALSVDAQGLSLCNFTADLAWSHWDAPCLPFFCSARLFSRIYKARYDFTIRLRCCFHCKPLVGRLENTFAKPSLSTNFAWSHWDVPYLPFFYSSLFPRLYKGFHVYLFCFPISDFYNQQSWYGLSVILPPIWHEALRGSQLSNNFAYSNIIIFCQKVNNSHYFQAVLPNGISAKQGFSMSRYLIFC